MIPYKLFVTSEDLAHLIDCSSDVAQNYLTQIRRHFNKPQRSKVTAREVAEFFHIKPNEVLMALNRELYKA